MVSFLQQHWTRILIALAVVAGLSGFALQAQIWAQADWRGVLSVFSDSLYQTIQLFALSGPPVIDSGGPFSEVTQALINFARFVAPLSLATAMVVAFEGLWRPSRVRRAIRRLDRFDLHWGSSDVTKPLVLANADGDHWTLIAAPEETYQIDRDSKVIHAPSDALIRDFHRKVLRPRALVFTDANDLENINALQDPALSFVVPEHRLVLVDETETRLNVIASAHLMRLPSGETGQPFGVSEHAARSYFHNHDVFLDAKGQDRLHWAFLGFGVDARDLALQLIKIGHHPDFKSPLLSIFGPVSDAVMALFDHLGDLVEVQIFPEITDTMHEANLAPAAQNHPVTTWYIGNAPARADQRKALALGDLLIRMDCTAPILMAPSAQNINWLRKSDYAGKHDISCLADDLEYLDIDHITGEADRLARRFHFHYSGYKSIPAGAQEIADWRRLEENLKSANRRAADAAKTKLEALGIAGSLGSILTSKRAIPAPSAERLEALAQTEHRSWMADRLINGWRPAEVRDDQRRLHPALKPYSALSEEEKDLDRKQIDTLLILLSQTSN